MLFETTADVLNWYEKQPRTLTPEFIASIPWHEVKNYPLDPRFIPVMIYMRDVEILTEIYHQHMLKTPTGKDKHICKFMERWGVEEITHGEVINRFLGEAGMELPENLPLEARRDITLDYRLNIFITTLMTNCIGKSFTGSHMAFGAINEMCTLQSYRRLDEICEHPVLNIIMKAIMREESLHSHFYWSVARIELRRSDLARKLARFIIKHFWVPVGQGAKTKKDAESTVRTLFGAPGALDILDHNVTKRAQTLPGFEGLNTVTEKLGKIIAVPEPALATPIQ